MQPGHIFRVFVNGTAYKSNRVRYKATMQPTDVSNSEGQPGFPVVDSLGNAVGGLGLGINNGGGLQEWLDFPWESVQESIPTKEIEVQNATYDPLENRWDTLFRIRIGIYVALEVQPLRQSGIASYRVPCALVIDVDHDMQLRDNQPFTFRVRTDGYMEIPGLQIAIP